MQNTKLSRGCNPIVNILFSGGYDSTLLLCDAVIVEKTEVNVITIEPDFSHDKVERERKARNEIIKVLREKYDARITVSTIKIDISASHYVDSTYLTQPLFWLPAIFTLTKADENNEVRIGYILGDQALTHTSDFEEMAKAVSHFKDKELYITFPLKYYSKEEVLMRLYTEFTDIIDLCTSCETHYTSKDMKEGYCQRCNPCKHMIKALKYIASDSTRDIKFRKWAVEKLKNYNINAECLIGKTDSMDHIISECRWRLNLDEYKLASVEIKDEKEEENNE